MDERLKTFGAPADALRRAVGRNQIGIFRFERFQSFEQFIKLEIRDFRRVFLVIKLVVPVDFGAQRFDFGLDIVFG